MAHRSAQMYVRPGCAYCARARAALRAAGIDTVELPIDAADSDLERLLAAVAPHVVAPRSEITGRYLAPQVFLRDNRRSSLRYIGGADELDRRLTPPAFREGTTTPRPQHGPFPHRLPH